MVVYDHFSKTAKLLSFCAADNRVLSPVLRIHNRFGGMRDLALFVVILGIRAKNRSGNEEILITSGSGISYFYGLGMRET